MIFTMNDDRMLMEFLSGRYLGYPEAHSIYMNYPFTLLIASLYKVLPNYNWYSIILISIMFLCVMLVYVRCFQKFVDNKKWIMFFIPIPILLFALGQNFIALTYSTVAATVGVTTLFWYGTSKGTKTDIIISGVLAALTWCIRDELLIMILPAAGLIWLFRDVLQDKTTIKKIITPMFVALCVGICILCDSIAYSSVEWKEFNEYNKKVRTEIYDYQGEYYLPKYDENKEFYDELEISNEERRMLIYSSFTFLQDEFPIENFSKIVELRSKYDHQSDEKGFGFQVRNGTENFINHLKDGRYGVQLYFGMIGFCVTMLMLFLSKNKKALLENAMIAVEMFAIIWLMEIRGRVPERVAYSLSLMNFVMLLLVWIWHLEEFGRRKQIKYFVTLSILLLGILGFINTTTKVIEAKDIEENNLKYEEIRNYCQNHEDEFFVISIGALDDFGINVTAAKIDNSQNNYISFGDWMVYSPVELERLKQEGISSVSKAVVENDNVYIISEEDDNYLQYTVDYLESRFSREILVEKTDRIAQEYCVYKLKFAK